MGPVSHREPPKSDCRRSKSIDKPPDMIIIKQSSNKCNVTTE